MSPADQVRPGGADPAADVLDTAAAGPLALRGGGLRVAGYAGGMLLGLVSVPLLIRHLGQERFGDYVTALSIATIAIGLAEGGVNTIALREFASRAGAARDAAMSSMLGIRLLLSAVGLVAAVAFAAGAGYDGAIVAGVAVVGIGLAIQGVQMLVAVPLQGTMRLGTVAAVDLLRNGLTTALIVVLVLAGAGIVPLLAAVAPACLVTLLVTARLVREAMPLRPEMRFATYAPLLRETFPFAIAIALNSVYFRVTVVVMSLAATGLETGYFSTSFRVVEIIIALPVLVIGAAYPIVTRAHRDDPERFANAVRRMFELSLVAGTAIALALVLGARFATDVLGGAEAAPAAPVLRIQGLALIGTFVAVAAGFPLLAMGRYKPLLVANALGLVVTLAVALSLVPSMGAKGAAIATVAAEVALAVATVVALVRASPGLRLSLAALPIVLGAGCAGAGAGWLLAIHPVVDSLVGLVVYGTGLALLGRFPPEVGHALRRGPAAEEG
jgi:O-antigen/teichoic acid export membrane protein